MAKPNIITRATKGSALTWTEGDANLENLRDATIGISDGTTSGTLDLNDTLTFTAGTNVTVSYEPNSKSLTINSTATGGLQSISEDTSPVLGGTLNVNNNYITSNLDENVRILPSGVGRVNLSGLLYPSVDGTAGQVLSTDGNGNISWSSAGGLTSISQDTAPALGGNLDVGSYSITSSTGGISLSPAYSFPVTINGMQWPTIDGTSGQVLTTNGYGSLSWSSASGGSLNQDYNPQLVADLDVQYSGITTSVLNGSIGIRPNGTGQLVIGSYNTDAIITTNGTGDLKLSTNNDTSSGYILIADGYDGDIYLAPSGNGKSVINNINYYETPYTLTYGATITPNVANGTVQIVTLTGNVTFSEFTSPAAGQSLTLIVKQDATGSRILTSTMKFAGGTKTLSTAANSVDIISVFYDGTDYWASLGKDFK